MRVTIFYEEWVGVYNYIIYIFVGLCQDFLNFSWPATALTVKKHLYSWYKYVEKIKK